MEGYRKEVSPRVAKKAQPPKPKKKTPKSQAFLPRKPGKRRRPPAGVKSLQAAKFEVNLPKEPIVADKIHKTRIVTWTEKAFGIPIRGKATHRFKALGRFFGKQELIRLQKWGDLEVLMHEVAHHIDNRVKKSLGKFWIRNLVKPGQKKKVLSELKDLDYDPKQRRLSEGFAEYMRHFLTTGLAPKKAPLFHKFFVTTFLNENPDLKKRITQLKGMMDTWQNQGSENRVLSQIDFKGEHTKVGGFADKMQRAKDWILTNFHDEFYLIQKIEDQMGLKVGKNITPTQDPFTMATFAKSKAGIIARTFVNDKAIDEFGREVGPSLSEVLKPIPRSQMKTFIAYGVSKRAINLSKRGKVKTVDVDNSEFIVEGIESGIDIDDAEFIVNKFKSATWDKAVDDLTQWSNHLLDWVVRAGGLGPKEAELIRELNPVYLPFKRAFVDEVQVIKGGGGFINQGSVVKRIKGSGRPILNPIEALIAQAAEMINKAQKIRIAGLMADIAEREGVGGFISKVPAPQQAARVTKDWFVQQLNNAGVKVGDISNLDDIMTVFTQAWQYRGKDNVVSIWRNGKREFFEIHKDLYRALSGVDPLVMPKVVRVIFSPFARMLRLGATGLKVSFGLARNPFRDAMTFAVFSKRPAATVLDPLVGLYKEITTKPGDLVSRFKRTGGSLAGMMGFDRAATMATYDEMLLDKLGKIGKVLKVAKHPVNTMRTLLSFTEMAPRSFELQKTYDKSKKDHPEWTEDDWFVAAFNEAQDITVNFTKSGFFAKRINEVAAFFNVAIRGPEKLFRSLRERPFQTLIKGIIWVTIPALTMWWKNREKQWYKNLPPAYKYNNFFVEIPDSNIIVRLPIPFDLGILFASAPMAFMDTMLEKDPKFVKGLMDQIKMQLPNPTPTIFGPWLDVKRNKNFLNIPIESAGMQFLFPTERKRIHTLPLSIALSKALHTLRIAPGGETLSPIQIEFLIDSYTGGWARQLPLRPLIEPADMPIIGDLLLRMPVNPKQQTNEFFSEFERLSQRKQSDIATREELKKLARMRPLYNTLIKVHFKRLKAFRAAKDLDRLKETYEQMTALLARFGFK